MSEAGAALPRWWIVGTATACVGCVALFGLAFTLESVVLGFIAILALLLAATGLPIALQRQQARQQAASENP